MCLKDFIFFIICYKVIDVYPSKIYFHNNDTLIALNIDTLLLRRSRTPGTQIVQQSALFVYNVRTL